ncbi:hypothetical protein [Candidatus Chloroploca asiatica]|uniref:hypothetical protein n=1 Tax=Candidatus Chloroploca asiatica TaxID=1506545 RepID=UPI00114133D9|nr:hypothetical protein [Candidatus Chloroploca asiatica]
MPKGHDGKHDEFPYLRHLLKTNPTVAAKIKRDSTMTTGAAWKSEDAGPNRILRWMMLLSDEELLEYGVNMVALSAQVVAKLREKAANYESCMRVARKLTWLAYQMPGAPVPLEPIRIYLEDFYGSMNVHSTYCLVCRLPLHFDLFANARRGKADVETAHSNPRIHDDSNVGFAHRECNIAQGAKTLPEFYAWIEAILDRVKAD